MLSFSPQLKLAATAWACLAILTTTAAAQADDKPVHIGNRVEPFVDTYLIDRFEGDAKLQLHKPVDRDVAIVHDAPWEGNTSCYHTIFQDGDLYRLYYRGHHVSKYDAMGGADHKEFICYAESKDGISWVKPKLGIVEFNSSKDNNIVWAGPHGTHNFAPFKDANPKAKPDEQYKAMGTGKGGQFIFKSPDGIHWQLMHDKPVITEGAFDSLNIAYFDAARKRYVDFHRDFLNGVRGIKTATSDDFLTWTDPDWITYPGVPAEHLYTNGITPYFRAPHIFIGLPKRLVPGPNPAKHAYGGVSDAVFMTSRDGVVFSRWTEAIVRPGLQTSRWVNRNNMPAWGIVETKSSMPGAPNEVSIYTTEDYYQGSGTALRRHTYRLDGFVSINAPLSGGEAVTKPIVFAGAAKSVAKPEVPTLPEAVKLIDKGGLIGRNALRFENPAIAVLRGTKNLGRQVTIAAHVRNVPAGHKRLFSAYNGGGTTPNELFFSFDSDGDLLNGESIRFGYNGTVAAASTAGTGKWSNDDKVHHLAMTWNDGIIALFFDGAVVAKNGESGGGDMTLQLGDLRFGEDYPPTSTTNEAFEGDVDDILVLRRVLNDQEIAQLASQGASAVTERQSDAGVLIDFESAESPLTDRLDADAVQAVSFTKAIEAQRGEMELTLNMSTSAAGSIQVALLDAEGKAIPGYGFNECDTLIGDGVNIPVSWSGNTELNQLAGMPIRVHFRLKDADIYAMQFGDDADNLGDVLVSAVGEDSAASKSLELLSVKKIYDHAPHNAFTDLIRFNGQWVCGFRASPAHAGGIQGAKMQILVSDDADTWTSVAALDDDRGDIRDAKFGITPDGRLMMLTAIQQFDTSKQMHQSLVWLTNDLKTWDGPYDVADPDVWTWGIQWHKGVGYSIGYGTIKRFVRLYTTKNGTEMDTHVSNLEVDSDYPNESSIVFAEDDTAYCLLRCTGPAQFGIAKPPYKDWQWKKIGVPVGGPKMIQLPDGRLIGGGRLYDGGARTSLFWIDQNTGALTEILKLPSGGDTSYPGMVLHEGILHVSYYSSHEGKTSVYLAKLKIAEKTN
jgi:hypothetical protein